MTDLRKAAEMALEALEWNYGTDLENIENCTAWLDKMNATIPALRQALAHPPCENGAQCLGGKCPKCVPTYEFECPRCGHCCQQREWVGLTDEESKPLIQKSMMYYGHNPDHWTLTAGAGFCILVRAIEAKLKEKNT